MTRLSKSTWANNAGSVLWQYEMNHLSTVYKWMLTNRTGRYAKCCTAVVVYQIKASATLPPGFYVYKRKPRHFGCTLERPIEILDQFNFVASECNHSLPNTITVHMFPGRESYSAMYILNRKVESGRPCTMIPEYGNRVFGEVAALGILDTRTTDTFTACKHHMVAVRNERMCVLDLRWRAMETKSACLDAIPKVRGLKAVMWSNHSDAVQDVECSILAWLFGLSNTLPKEVQLVDYSDKHLGVRYILVDMDMYPGPLPKPPCSTESCYVHIYFLGDRKHASSAIGKVPASKSRMGSPLEPFECWYVLPALDFCQPTPFSCGVKSDTRMEFPLDKRSQLSEWTTNTDAGACQGLAVQHTLYYHATKKEYKMMICHTVTDTDTSLSMFRL